MIVKLGEKSQCRHPRDSGALHQGGKQSQSAIKYHIVNLLQKAEIPQKVSFQRVLRPRSQGVDDPGCWDSRLVEFTNQRHKARFSASAGRIKTNTRDFITIEPEDTATSKIKAEYAKDGSPGISIAVSKLRIHKLGE